MKFKSLLFFLAFAVAATAIEAAVRAPQDVRGDSLETIDWVGAETWSLGNSTSTSAVLIGSGRIVVYGVTASSIAATNYLVFRDTATANITSSTKTIVYANGTDANASGASTTLTIKFPVPMKFTNGVSVNASAAPTADTGSWTILYRPLAATE
jgi:hypothetical protein